MHIRSWEGRYVCEWPRRRVYKKTKQLASADVAQSVERRLGKAEVGGSIPLGSLFKLTS